MSKRSPGYPGFHYVNQAVLKVRYPPACVGIKSTIPDFKGIVLKNKQTNKTKKPANSKISM